MKEKIMKKKILFLITISIIITTNYYYFQIKQSKKYTIAVIQCAPNKSLDLLSSSFINKITQLLDSKNLTIIYKNADASLSNAHAIAEQLHANKDINLFFTIGSSVSQAIAILEKERPIIIAGVTDPYAYNLNQNNVCGTIDTIDEDFILKMINTTHSYINKIGILRTAGDINGKEFNYFRELCQKHNKHVIDFAVNTESDILAIIEKVCQEIDVLLIPCDSLVVSVLPYIAKITKKHKIPLFTCFVEGISLGALRSTGIDYGKNGISSAEIAFNIIINKKNPKDINFKKAKYDKIYY